MFDSACRWLNARTDKLIRDAASGVPADPERGEALSLPERKRLFARRQFRIGRQVRCAYVRIACRDMYKLYLNGRFVCRGPRCSGPFAPEDAVDIAPFIKPGLNLLALDIYSMDGKPGFAAQLSTDGKTKWVSDRSFALSVPEGLCHAWSGETLDLGIFDPNWMTRMPVRGEACAAVGSDAPVFPPAAGDAPLAGYRYAEAKRLDAGLYDFGRAYAGDVLVKVSGERGARVSLEYSLNEKPFLKGPERVDTVILGGGRVEAEFCIPQFVRFIRVRADKGAQVEGVTLRAQTVPALAGRMHLETDDEALKEAFGRRAEGVLSVDAAGLVRLPACQCPFVQRRALSFAAGDGRYLHFEPRLLSAFGTEVRPGGRGDATDFLLRFMARPLPVLNADYVCAASGGRRDESGLWETFEGPGRGQKYATVNALAIGIQLRCGLDDGEMRGLQAAFDAAFLCEKKGLYAETSEETAPSKSANILAVYFGFANDSVMGHLGALLDEPIDTRLEYFRLKLLARAGRWDALYGAFLDPKTPDEAALTVFVEDILGITAESLSGRKWEEHLPENIQSARAELLFGDMRAVYERLGGRTLLYSVKQ